MLCVANSRLKLTYFDFLADRVNLCGKNFEAIKRKTEREREREREREYESRGQGDAHLQSHLITNEMRVASIKGASKEQHQASVGGAYAK